MRLCLLILVSVSGLSGCLWTPKPYAADPLIRNRRAVLGNPQTVREIPPFTEPVAPTENEP